MMPAGWSIIREGPAVLTSLSGDLIISGQLSNCDRMCVTAHLIYSAKCRFSLDTVNLRMCMFHFIVKVVESKSKVLVLA